MNLAGMFGLSGKTVDREVAVAVVVWPKPTMAGTVLTAKEIPVAWGSVSQARFMVAVAVVALGKPANLPQ